MNTADCENEMIKHLDGTHETIEYTTETMVKLYHNENCQSYPLHWHTGIEIIYPLINSYDAVIGTIPVHLNEGELLIIPPGTLHTLTAPKDYGKRLIIQTDYPLFSHNQELRILLNILKPFCHITASNQELLHKLTDYILLIDEEYTMASHFYETAIMSLIENFFVTLGRFSISATANTSLVHENALSFLSICNYININFNKGITLEKAAALTGYSKSYFCRYFKKYAGKSFYSYLLEVQVSHADYLLCSTDKRITDIALDSGFSSIATFNRVFQQFHSCSPSEYRKLFTK